MRSSAVAMTRALGWGLGRHGAGAVAVIIVAGRRGCRLASGSVGVIAEYGGWRW